MTQYGKIRDAMVVNTVQNSVCPVCANNGAYLLRLKDVYFVCSHCGEVYLGV